MFLFPTPIFPDRWMQKRPRRMTRGFFSGGILDLKHTRIQWVQVGEIFPYSGGECETPVAAYLSFFPPLSNLFSLSAWAVEIGCLFFSLSLLLPVNYDNVDD